MYVSDVSDVSDVSWFVEHPPVLQPLRAPGFCLGAVGGALWSTDDAAAATPGEEVPRNWQMESGGPIDW